MVEYDDKEQNEITVFNGKTIENNDKEGK